MLQAAERLYANGRGVAAAALIHRLAPPREFLDSNLALANLALADPPRWLERINAYFAAHGLSEIRLAGDGTPSLLNLSGAAPPARGPLVSVIMSAYNAERYMAAAARSILEQSWRNLELIVVDDCSTDSTVRIVEDLAQTDARVRLIRNPVNAGTYVCRNIALDQCTGEFVTTQDSDDWAHPDRIRIQAQDLIDHPQLPANMARNVRMTEDGRFELTSFGTYITYRCCASMMMRVQSVKPVFGYWDSVRVSADNEYIERMLTVHGPEAVKINPLPLVVQLRRQNSLTTVPETLGLSGRMSNARRQYQNAYVAWHKRLTGTDCALPFPQVKRVFFAPDEIAVPLQVMLRVLGQAAPGQGSPQKAAG